MLYQGESSIKTTQKPRGEFNSHQKLKTKKWFSQNFVEHLIRVLKIFRVASERFRLSKYEQIIMTICGVAGLLDRSK